MLFLFSRPLVGPRNSHNVFDLIPFTTIVLPLGKSSVRRLSSVNCTVVPGKGSSSNEQQNEQQNEQPNEQQNEQQHEQQHEQ